MLDIYSKGIERIYAEALEEQTYYLNLVCKDIREIDIQVFLDNGAFYIPNEHFLIHFFGEEITNPEYGYYSYDGLCRWMRRLVLPVRDLNNNIIGLIGYDPVVKMMVSEGLSVEDVEAKFNGDGLPIIPYAYIYSNKKVFNRNNYFFYFNDALRRAYREKYVILVDGTFDAISLASKGFVAMSAMGSFMNDILYFQLAFIDRLYVAYDNDTAGYTLLKQIRKRFPKVLEITQGVCKDIDGILKSEHSEKFLKFLDKGIKSNLPINICYKTYLSRF